MDGLSGGLRRELMKLTITLGSLLWKKCCESGDFMEKIRRLHYVYVLSVGFYAEMPELQTDAGLGERDYRISLGKENPLVYGGTFSPGNASCSRELSLFDETEQVLLHYFLVLRRLAPCLFDGGAFVFWKSRLPVAGEALSGREAFLYERGRELLARGGTLAATGPFSLLSGEREAETPAEYAPFFPEFFENSRFPEKYISVPASLIPPDAPVTKFSFFTDPELKNWLRDTGAWILTLYEGQFSAAVVAPDSLAPLLSEVLFFFFPEAPVIPESVFSGFEAGEPVRSFSPGAFRSAEARIGVNGPRFLAGAPPLVSGEFWNACDVKFLRGIFLFASGKLSQAETCWRSCLEDMKPGSLFRRQARYFLGELDLYRGRSGRYFPGIPLLEDMLAISADYYFERGDFFMASRLLEVFDACGFRHCFGRLTQAKIYLNSSRFAKALKILGKMEGYLPARRELAFYYGNTAEKHRARQLFCSIVQADPGDYVSRFEIAGLFLEEEKPEEALRELRYLMQNHPEFAPSYHLYGKIRMELDDSEEARQYIGRALRLDPANAGYLVSMAVYFIRADAPAEAEDCLIKAVSIEPFHVDALSLLAELYYFSGRYEQAYELYGRLVFIDEKNALYVLRLSEISRHIGETAMAEEILSSALRNSPDSVDTMEALGWLYLERGAFDEAEALFDNALEQDQENLMVLYGKALLLFKKERWEEVEALCRLCLALAPDCDAALFLLSRTASRKKDFAGALRMIGKALKINPEKTDYLVEKAWALFFMGRARQAFALIKPFFDGEEKLPVKGYMLLSEVLLGETDFSGAGRVMEEAYRAYPQSLSVYTELCFLRLCGSAAAPPEFPETAADDFLAVQHLFSRFFQMDFFYVSRHVGSLIKKTKEDFALRRLYALAVSAAVHTGDLRLSWKYFHDFELFSAEEALKLPEAPGLFFLRGKSELLRRRLEEQLQCCCSDYMLRINLACTHMYAGRLEKAGDMIEPLLRGRRRSLALYLLAFEFYSVKGSFAQAEKYFLSAFRWNPCNLDSHLCLFHLYHTRGAREKLKKNIQDIVGRVPRCRSFYTDAYFFLTEGRFRELLELCVQAPDPVRQSPMYKIIYSCSCAGTGDVEKAARELSPILSRLHQPWLRGDCHYDLGVMYWMTGRPDEAAREFRRAAAVSKGRGRASLSLVFLLYLCGKHREAALRLEEWMEKGDAMPEAWFLAGLVSFSIGDGREAVKFFKKTLRYFPGDVRAKSYLKKI